MLNSSTYVSLTFILSFSWNKRKCVFSLIFLRVRDHFFHYHSQTIRPRIIKFGKKVCLLFRKKCIHFEGNLTRCWLFTPRGINPEFLKIVVICKIIVSFHHRIYLFLSQNSSSYQILGLLAFHFDSQQAMSLSLKFQD